MLTRSGYVKNPADTFIHGKVIHTRQKQVFDGGAWNFISGSRRKASIVEERKHLIFYYCHPAVVENGDKKLI